MTRLAARRARTFVFASGANRNDAQYAHLERLPGCNVGISVATVFDRDITKAAVRRTMLRAVSEVGRLRDCLQHMPAGLAPPVWTVAEGFRLDDHLGFTALPPGATWSDVMAVVDRRHSSPFRPGQPPWFVEYVEGAPGGRCLVMMHLHHALSDGSGLATMLSSIFARRFVQAAKVEIVTADEPSGDARWAVLGRQWRDQMRDWLGVVGERAPQLAASSEARRAEQASLAEYARPPRWRRPRSPARRTTLFRISKARWEAAARERNGNVNDLYLALAAASMREYLNGCDAPARMIRVVMPVNVRQRTERQDAGNVTRAGVLYLHGTSDELDDLAPVRSAARKALHEQLAATSGVVDATVAVLPGGLQARSLMRRFAKTDVMATNVTVPVACEFDGHTAEMMFVIPSVIGAAVAFGLGRYEGWINLAVTLDRGVVLDPGRLPVTVERLLGRVLGPEHVTRLGPAVEPSGAVAT